MDEGTDDGIRMDGRTGGGWTEARWEGVWGDAEFVGGC